MGAALSTAAFHAPETVTKQLKLNVVGERRKVRVSSNFLPLMAFEPGTRVTPVPMLDGGFRVIPDPAGTLQVYQRRYQRGRNNNPLEAVMEFSNQALIRATMPAGIERFHVRMRHGELRVCPVPNRVFNIRQRMIGKDPLRTLIAMTGGVDMHCLNQLGFHTDVILEYRPEEARDRCKGRNLSEVHALNTLRNGAPRILVNESIYDVDPQTLKGLLADGDPVFVGHFSIQCDDFSSAKSASLREKSLEDMTTSIDMVYPVLRQIELLELGVVVIENVRGFKDSGPGQVMRSMLRRWGYHVTDMVLDARDYGGITGRTRYYCVASLFPGFQPPVPKPRRQDTIWPVVEKHLKDCRDVTDTRAIQARETSARVAAVITPESTYAPTILKSQDRGIKDAVYIQHQGRYLKPSEGLIRDLLSIPEAFDTSWMAKEQSIETLGQSIDYRLHHAVMASVKQHIEENVGPGPVLTHSKQVAMSLA